MTTMKKLFLAGCLLTMKKKPSSGLFISGGLVFFAK